VRATSASSTSVFAALRSPIIMPSPVARLAVTTTGPPRARDARDQQVGRNERREPRASGNRAAHPHRVIHALAELDHLDREIAARGLDR
jgi:hypothetical protein